MHTAQPLEDRRSFHSPTCCIRSLETDQRFHILIHIEVHHKINVSLLSNALDFWVGWCWLWYQGGQVRSLSSLPCSAGKGTGSLAPTELAVLSGTSSRERSWPWPGNVSADIVTQMVVNSKTTGTTKKQELTAATAAANVTDSTVLQVLSETSGYSTVQYFSCLIS